PRAKSLGRKRRLLRATRRVAQRHELRHSPRVPAPASPLRTQRSLDARNIRPARRRRRLDRSADGSLRSLTRSVTPRPLPSRHRVGPRSGLRRGAAPTSLVVPSGSNVTSFGGGDALALEAHVSRFVQIDDDAITG